VTGLTVLDTERDFTLFGQGVILLLIQVGGLGIMTFATGALALLNRRASLKQESAMAGLLGAQGAMAMFTATKQIIAITFATEAAGALILAAAFMTEGDSIGQALWRGLFTSVSAFCNAGFAIQSDNLISYQGNPLVLHTVAFLIIVGGLGPIPVIAIPALFRAKPISLHARLALITTALLLVLPTVLIAAFEWSHSLGHLSFADRIHNAWFQSVTPRTAGFNSIDFTALQPATVVLTILLMYVGGSPGSTAGGVKTTTLAVLVLSVISVVLGRNEPVVGGRRIGVTSVYRAMAIATMGALSAFVAVTALMLTQQMDPLDLIFEVFSALGTVGLTVGATPLLDDVGKIVIMACMFAGRVGPLTLFLLLQDRPAEEKWNYPTEETPVG
jgi:trk system potassium uptake protein TrkH